MANPTIGLSLASSGPAEAGAAAGSAAAARIAASAQARRLLELLEGAEPGGLDRDICREPGGRPFLRGRASDFSVSHSGGLAAVARASGAGLRVGCDAERVRPRAGLAGIAGAFFSPGERRYAFRGAEPDPERFCRIWALKECFLKLRGLSVFDMALAPSFADGRGRLALGAAARGAAKGGAPGAPLSFALYRLSGGAGIWALAAALEGEGGAPFCPELRWLSGSALDCRLIAQAKAAPGPAA